MNAPHVPGWGFARMAVALARRRNNFFKASHDDPAARDVCERCPASFPVSLEYYSIIDAAGGYMAGIMPIYHRHPPGWWIPTSVHL